MRLITDIALRTHPLKNKACFLFTIDHFNNKIEFFTNPAGNSIAIGRITHGGRGNAADRSIVTFS